MVARVSQRKLDLPYTARRIAQCWQRYVVERPKRVFVEGFNALVQTNLNTIRQEIVLTQKILFLDSGK